MALTKCKECGTEISTKAEQCPKCGAKGKKKTSLFAWICAVVFGLWMIGFIFQRMNATSGASASASASSSSSAPSAETALQNVKLDFSWKKAGFDSIMKADFTVTNNNAFAIKDIEITCTHSANSGTVIDRNNRTIYEIVKANGKRKFPDFDMGFIHSQAASSSCQITSVKT